MGNVEQVIATVASSQGGALTRSQLRGAGVSESEIEWALRSGQLERRASGVMAVGGAPGTRWQQWWIAHLAAGPDSAVAFGTAGIHWRFDGVRSVDPTVVVAHSCSPTDQGIVVRRTRRLDPIDVRVVAGLPFTTPARTVMDLAAECGPARLGMIVDSAHFSGAARYHEVGAVLLRIGGRGRTGSGRLAGLLDDRCGDPLSASQLEHQLADLLGAAGLALGRDAVRQHPLPSMSATTGTVDLFLPSAAVIVEADGRRWHQRQSDMKRDRERDFAAAQVGVLTLRFLHEHLTSDLDGCAAGLCRVIATRGPELGAIAPA